PRPPPRPPLFPYTTLFRSDRVEQLRVEDPEPLQLPRARHRNMAEVRENEREQLIETDRRVEHEHAPDVGPELGEQASEQCRLAGTGLADQRDEPFALVDPEAQRCERLTI